MIRSMTAFARQELQAPWGTLVWEIKTVNHRYLEVSPRLPEDLRVLEPKVRELAGKHLKRGKVECNCRLKLTAETQQLTVDEAFTRSLLEAETQVAGMMSNPARISPMDLLKWPGVLRAQEADWEGIRAAAAELLDEALADVVRCRAREGEKMAEIIGKRCSDIATHVLTMEQEMPEIGKRLREKLAARIEELQASVDNERLEQEVAMQLQKIDVAEELDRLRLHNEEVQRLLGSGKPVGRRLDFLMQELNREANTLGSKSVDIKSSRASVDLKVCIEQMREQVQNIE